MSNEENYEDLENALALIWSHRERVQFRVSEYPDGRKTYAIWDYTTNEEDE